MALNIGDLDLAPAVHHASVISPFTGDDDHIAVLQYRESGGAWSPGFPMVQDKRAEVYESLSPVPNPYVNQNRDVIFWLEKNTRYRVKVTYVSGGVEIGSVEGDVTTREDYPPVTGNTYYASPNGTSGGDGTKGHPWSLLHAVDMVAPGDCIRLLPGTYPGQVVISKSGTPGNYIHLVSDDPDNRAEITGDTGSSYGILRVSGSYWMFKDIIAENQSTGDGGAVFYFRYGGASYNIVDNCRATLHSTSWHAACVLIKGEEGNRPKGIIVKNSELLSAVDGYNGPFGIMLENTGGHHSFYDNQFIGGFFDAIGGSPNSKIYGGPYINTHIYRNTISGPHGDGIELEGGSINCSCWDNDITDCGYMNTGLAGVYVGPTYIFRTKGLGAGLSNFKLGSSSTGFIFAYHNSVVGQNVNVAAWGSDSKVANFVSRNNIFAVTGGDYKHVSEGSSGWGLMDFDYDLMNGGNIKWLGSNMDWQKWRTNYGQEPHGKYGDPLFVDQANGDFRLKEGSPAIDAGVILPRFNDENSPWPYQGGAPDMGAIESGIVGPPHASFEADVSSGYAPLTVKFTNKSTGSIDSYLWDFGDGSSSTGANPTHQYETPGVFKVTLTAFGPGGDSQTSLDIEVIETHTLTIQAGTGGTTNPEPDQYQVEGTLKVTALPDSDYRFAGWQEDGTVFSTANPVDIVMTGDRTITAVFEYVQPPPDKYIVTITSVGGGLTSPSGEVMVTAGDLLDIEAFPASNYKFSHWEGDVSGTNPKLRILNIRGNLSVVAVFVKSGSIVPVVAGVGAVAGVVSLIAAIRRARR